MRKTTLLLLCLAALLAVCGMMLADRRAVHAYSGAQAYPENIHRGDTITIVLEIERHRDCPGTVHRSLLLSDGTRYLYDPVQAARGPQVSYYRTARPGEWPRPGSIVREFRIPIRIGGRVVPSGPTIYSARVEYYCNFMQQFLRWPIVHEAPNITFRIID